MNVVEKYMMKKSTTGAQDEYFEFIEERDINLI